MKDINPVIRDYRPQDLEAIKRLTIDAFEGVTLEQNIETMLGVLHGHDWRSRKARHIDEDVQSHAEGIFVAVADERVVGFVSSRVDRDLGKGRIPNLAVAAEFRGLGLGRRLIDHALDYFRAEGLEYAVIETMADNEAGQHLYPACGFLEVARQIHYARRL
jgi:ribosomal protein S18 acetylase RimI-like enzyme